MSSRRNLPGQLVAARLGDAELWGLWKQAAQIREKGGSMANTRSGGTAQHRPVIMGRDFTGLASGATPGTGR
jgi:hypothetical protein